MFRRREPAPLPEGLVVGPSDHVQGTVTAVAVTVLGAFQGDLSVERRLGVATTGKFTGTIRAAQLSIDAGATVRAAVRVGMAATDEPAFLFASEPTEPVLHQDDAPAEPSRPVTRDDDGGATGLGW
ncbi:MAG: polymer-forming cytoskeletal protein [Gemmatimonadaceae bacterium]|nr:polymer-forming cytoskeletal protein [Gemmatimonadaceae bacterium]